MDQPTQKVNTAVFDKGRRGLPLTGCDCVQCFGYCMIDGDEVVRLRRDNGPIEKEPLP